MEQPLNISSSKKKGTEDKTSQQYGCQNNAGKEIEQGSSLEEYISDAPPNQQESRHHNDVDEKDLSEFQDNKSSNNPASSSKEVEHDLVLEKSDRNQTSIDEQTVKDVDNIMPIVGRPKRTR